MDAEGYVDAALGERVVKLANFVLGLRYGHAVAGNDDDAAGGAETRGGFFGGGALDRALLLRARACGLALAGAAGNPLAEGTTHCLWPSSRENEAGGTP